MDGATQLSGWCPERSCCGATASLNLVRAVQGNRARGFPFNKISKPVLRWRTCAEYLEAHGRHGNTGFPIGGSSAAGARA